MVMVLALVVNYTGVLCWATVQRERKREKMRDREKYFLRVKQERFYFESVLG